MMEEGGGRPATALRVNHYKPYGASDSNSFPSCLCGSLEPTPKSEEEED